MIGASYFRAMETALVAQGGSASVPSGSRLASLPAGKIASARSASSASRVSFRRQAGAFPVALLLHPFHGDQHLVERGATRWASALA